MIVRLKYVKRVRAKGKTYWYHSLTGERLSDDRDERHTDFHVPLDQLRVVHFQDHVVFQVAVLEGPLHPILGTAARGIEYQRPLDDVLKADRVYLQQGMARGRYQRHIAHE